MFKEGNKEQSSSVLLIFGLPKKENYKANMAKCQYCKITVSENMNFFFESCFQVSLKKKYDE